MQTVQFSYFKFSKQLSLVQFNFHPEPNHVHSYLVNHSSYVYVNLLKKNVNLFDIGKYFVS